MSLDDPAIEREIAMTLSALLAMILLALVALPLGALAAMVWTAIPTAGIGDTFPDERLLASIGATNPKPRRWT